MTSRIKAVVLSAGMGKRMRSDGIDLPKVLRQACGRPLLGYVLDALNFLPAEDIILVIGWKKEMVHAAFPQYPYVVQETLNGTGGAVQYVAPLLTDPDSSVLICCGDVPLMQQSTFLSLIETHFREKNACTMLSALLEDGGAYGRILRDGKGNFQAIVESRDCTAEQLAVSEVNTGTYVFQVRSLLRFLSSLRPDNAQGELYLTDIPALMQAAGAGVGVCCTCSPEEMLGVNTPQQLREVETVLQKRTGGSQTFLPPQQSM